jgi:hypothetical protein
MQPKQWAGWADVLSLLRRLPQPGRMRSWADDRASSRHAHSIVRIGGTPRLGSVCADTSGQSHHPTSLLHSEAHPLSRLDWRSYEQTED